MTNLKLCPICDGFYLAGSEEEKMHEHPEPQSGAFRDYWLWSRLSYDRWITETEKGKEWIRQADQRAA